MSMKALAERLLAATRRKDSARVEVEEAEAELKAADEALETYRAGCDHSLKLHTSWPVDYGAQSPVNMVRQWRCIHCLMLVDENVRQEKGRVFDPWRSGWFSEHRDELMLAAYEQMNGKPKGKR